MHEAHLGSVHVPFQCMCLLLLTSALRLCIATLSAHTPWVQLVSHVSAFWLTGLGFQHT